jgi:hypothetical protein
VSEPLASQKDSPNRFWSWAISTALFLLGVLGLGLLVFSILGLSGQVATPIGPVRQRLFAADFASSAVAGATLLLAAVTVLLALFTRSSLALGRAELALAEKSLGALKEQAVKLAEQVAATHVQAGAMQTLASATFSQVAATQQQAAIAQRTLEASWRPLLVDVPFGFATRPRGTIYGGGTEDLASVTGLKLDDGTGRVVVPFRNIGSGPAIISRAVLSFGQLHADATSFSSSIVAVSEVVRIRFEIAPAGAVLINLISQLGEGKPFTVTVFYVDQGSVGTWRSRAQLHCPSQAQGYKVLNVDLYEGDSNTPFATSGGGAP